MQQLPWTFEGNRARAGIAYQVAVVCQLVVLAAVSGVDAAWFARRFIFADDVQRCRAL